ncbi:MAG: AI-2E family transporter [Oscillospiraceae bacterium]|jgi:predicted PurR-regulated permease PerM|nr:AI-2E family transporter [Oscillospiraceae bacterium]
MKKRFKWDSQYVGWGVTSAAVIMASIVFYMLTSKWAAIHEVLQKFYRGLSPIVYGLVFAYLLNKVMAFFESSLLRPLCARLRPRSPERARRLTRILGVILTMALFLSLLGGSLALILPRLYSSAESLVARMPGYYRVAEGWVTSVLDENPELETAAVTLLGYVTDNLTGWIQDGLLAQANNIITNITSGVFGLLREIANIGIGIVFSVYMLYHKEKFAARGKKLLYCIFSPRFTNKLIRGLHFTDKVCGSFVVAKLIDSSIVGVACYIFMAIFKMPYAMLISVIVGVTNVIPFFGPFVGGIPSAVILLLENPADSLVFVVFIVVIQQIDGNILYPALQGSKTGMSGFWILFAILLFGVLFGFTGFLFGVPVFALIYAAVGGFVRSRLAQRGLPAHTDEYDGIAYIDAATREPVPFSSERDGDARDN